MTNDKSLQEGRMSKVCAHCIRWAGNRSCEAYTRIPDSIWRGLNNHSKPVEGDGGLRFVDRYEGVRPEGTREREANK